MQGYNYDRQSSTDERALWSDIIAGDKSALGTLFDLYIKELLAYGYRISGDIALTKDAVQDVFVDIWSYRSNLSKDVQVKFYLYRCVRRAVVRQISPGETSVSDFSDVERVTESTASPESEWVSAESEHLQNQRIYNSLKLLSEREREVISLKYYADMKIREIATLLNLKEQTVSNTLQNALTKLRKHLVYLLTLLFVIQ
jgi:RNA polymerase sigma factor (sigma-70 family)